MKRTSTMVSLVEDYLTVRRRLGFALEIAGEQLLAFARFADKAGHRGPVTFDLAVRWTQASPCPALLTSARRVEVLRPFLTYRSQFDAGTVIVPRNFFGPPHRRLVPHIYTEQEIAALLQATDNLLPTDGLRPMTYRTLFGLLAATGLRISEALHLQPQDVDLVHGILTVRQTKFRKSRLVPLHSTTAAALKRYVEAQRRQLGGQKADAFFVSDRGKPLPKRTVHGTFENLRTRLRCAYDSASSASCWLRPGRKPTTGYNYDTFAEDLRRLVTHLKLKGFTLVGFSMGGGEVARYLGRYGSKDVSKTVIIGGVPPYLLKTADNPEGVDASVFEGIKKAVAADRYAFFTEFFKNFYNTDVHLGKRVSEQAIQASWNTAAIASATASLACVPTWHEDFREDVAKIDVPTLVVHGDSDRIVPFSAAGSRTAKLINGAELVVVKDGPHNVAWTHAEEVNEALLKFLAKPSAKGQTTATKSKAVA